MNTHKSMPFEINIAEATPQHIPAMHRVRMSVRENRLSNPDLVREKDYLAMLENGGKGWICFIGKALAGFSMVDVLQRNIWALFVHPDFENQGIGRQLQQRMLDWSFEEACVESLWLSTAPGTRAEQFYRHTGWKKTGTTSTGEIRFEMSRADWPAGKKQAGILSKGEPE